MNRADFIISGGRATILDDKTLIIVIGLILLFWLYHKYKISNIKRPKAYSSFVRKLPVKDKQKTWLLKNWGGLLGAILAWIAVIFLFDILLSGMTGSISFSFSTIFLPFTEPSSTIWIIFILVLMIGFFIGKKIFKRI